MTDPHGFNPADSGPDPSWCEHGIDRERDECAICDAPPTVSPDDDSITTMLDELATRFGTPDDQS
jgi:hypothetical protein